MPGFAIHGAPRTKKTSQQIIQIPKAASRACYSCGHRPSFPKIMPSEQYREWEAAAIRECMTIKPKLRAAGVDLPIAHPIGIEALFYLAPTKAGSMRLDCPDLSNLLEALADMLQEAGIIQDDRLIEDWDGSRRVLGEPRVEVFITILKEIPVQEVLSLRSTARITL